MEPEDCDLPEAKRGDNIHAVDAICKVDTKLDRSSVNNGFSAQKQHEGSVIMLVMVLFRGSS